LTADAAVNAARHRFDHSRVALTGRSRGARICRSQRPPQRFAPDHARGSRAPPQREARSEPAAFAAQSVAARAHVAARELQAQHVPVVMHIAP